MTGTIYGLIDANTLELRYVGQTTRPERRRTEHLRTWPNLRMIVLEHNPPDGLDKAERRWIEDMKSQGARLLNIANGGSGPTAETRAKMSAAMKRPEVCAKLSAAHMGKILSAEHRAKISATLMGHPVSAETRAKLSAVNMGKTHSVETRAKLSAASTGENNPMKRPEARAKLSAANSGENNPNYGKTHSAETRARMSAALKGRIFSAEHKAKLSVASRARTHSYRERRIS